MAEQVLLEAEDREVGAEGERLALLAVIRGLEALDQPSRVTLLTTNRQVARGLRHALHAWKANDWHWERYGRWVPIKNADLWRRVDRALLFHEVECRCVAVDVEQTASVDGWHSRTSLAWNRSMTERPAARVDVQPDRRGWQGLWHELAGRLAWRLPSRSLAS
jgi:ribonuclease HI